MKKIFTEEFWKERIDNAQEEHYSVYVIHKAGWGHISKTHERLVKRYATGRVLDAGCGYGRISEWFPDGNYTGVDFSPDFIAKAKGKYHNKIFVQSDLRKLPFEDQTFDWAVCISIRKMVIDNEGNPEWFKIRDELKRVADKVLILEYENPGYFQIL